jgi:hypothetical protein
VRSKLVEDEPNVRLTSLHAAPPRQPPSMCMPNELLDEVFKHVFVELDDKPLRDRVRVYAPLSLVCKAWQRVAAPYPWTNVRLDVVEDSDVIACLDPVGGVGDRQLLLIKSLRLLASESLIQPAKKDEKEESGVGDEDEDGDSETPPARLSPILHGPANDETSSLPIVASVARILAKCSNLSVLSIDQRLESISCKVTADHDPSVIWPKLTRLILTWNCSFIVFLPVLARLSHLQELIGICLLLDTGDENNDSRGTMTQELVDKHPVQPLERLQNFRIRSFGEAPIGNQAVLRLLSPRAPLRRVTWAGHIPPGMCKELSRGTSEIEELTFTWMGATSNLTKQLLPQLFELGRRPVKRLTLDIEPILGFPRTQFMPPITEILKNLPYGVRFSRAIDMDVTVFSFRRAFPTGGADFAAIKARPTASITFNDTNSCKGSFDGKPLLQFGMFRVEESDDDVNLRFFGRFGDPDVEGDVTEWMLLKIVASEDDEEE